jgi:hypothetical protein
MHVDEMLIAYVPELHALYEGDAADYLLQARAVARYLEGRGLRVETVHSAHSRRPMSWADFLDDDASN